MIPLLVLLLSPFCLSLEDSLPVYLLGINWSKVQDYLQEDRSLPVNVVPVHYSLNLSVNVRGRNNAARSDYNGTLAVYLTVKNATDAIELHSAGLQIDKIRLFGGDVMNPRAGVVRISANENRETFAFHLNRTLLVGEKFELEINYRGLARTNEYGLYEHWTPKFNDTRQSFVLASRNFPAGARRWFPCFDEPMKMATFELTVSHPEGLTAHSNAEKLKVDELAFGRVTSFFTTTKAIPTYKIALAIVDFASVKMEIPPGSRITLLRSENHPLLSKSMRENDQIKAVESGLIRLAELDKRFLQDKLDIIFLDGTKTINIHPGLVTIGRDAQSQEYSEIVHRIGEIDFDYGHKYIRKNDAEAHKNSKITSGKGIGNFTKMTIANHLTVSADKIWLVDGLSRFFDEESSIEYDPYFYNSPSYPDRYITMKPDHFYTSLHEPSLRRNNVLLSSTSLFLDSLRHTQSLKAWQLFHLLHRMCPDSRNVFEKFISENREKLADTDDFIGAISEKCEPATDFLNDFIDQPGKAFLIVSRSKESVTIKQTRYHSSYFDVRTRDCRTRYTLPVFYTIDGESSMKMFPKNDSSISIQVPENATFMIDNDYDQLYNVYYDYAFPLRNWEQDLLTAEEKERMKRPLRRHVLMSLMSALEIGFISYETAINQVRYYLEKRIFFNTEVMFFAEEFLTYLNNHFEIPPSANHTYECRRNEEYTEATSWDGLFNNGSRYFEDIRSKPFRMSEYCMNEWRNASTYLDFLENNFLGDATSVVRPSTIDYVRQKGGSKRSWREFHRFFFQHAHNQTSPTWSRLAGVALAIKPFGDKPRTDWFYPHEEWRRDYIDVLRSFVRDHPQRAASMAIDIEMRMEREFIRDERRKFFNLSELSVLATVTALWQVEHGDT